MGINIYICAERRQPDGFWRLMGNMKPNHEFFLGGEEHYPNEDSQAWPPLIPSEVFEIGGRELFAILANVGNGIRTAGGQDFDYISLPRGLPEGLSPELQEFAVAWDDLQSPSWLLLQEILDFPWKEKTMLREAMVDARVAPLFGYKPPPPLLQEKQPPEMMQFRFPLSTESCLPLSPAWQPPEMPHVGFPLREWPKDVPISYATYKRDGVAVQWLETYEEIVRPSGLLEKLSPLMAWGDPVDTRLVFWFDW